MPNKKDDGVTLNLDKEVKPDDAHPVVEAAPVEVVEDAPVTVEPAEIVEADEWFRVEASNGILWAGHSARHGSKRKDIPKESRARLLKLGWISRLPADEIPGADAEGGD